jgi:molecular chaperone GrpE (heat shock protein)
VASAFEQIKDTWFTIRDNYDDLNQAAGSKEARAKLLADYNGARDAFYMALKKSFDEDDDFVKHLKAELAATKEQLDEALDGLQDIVATLGLVSAAVRLAAALAGMVLV